MHETVQAFEATVERITDRLLDPSRGPLEKGRDVLTGGGQAPTE